MPRGTINMWAASINNSSNVVHQAKSNLLERSAASETLPKQQETSTEKDTGFLNKLLVVTATLMLVSVVLYAMAQMYGEKLSRGEHSAATGEINMTIGSVDFAVPENTIRFPTQRQNGIYKRLELYLHWPSLSGYSDNLRREFNSANGNANLVFLTLEPRVMTYDMSGRIGPIYSRFFEGRSYKDDNGLIRQPLSAEGGFMDEELFYASSSPYPFAARCVSEHADISTPFCIRDIHVARDLMLTYRFHKKFLPNWIELDQAMRSYVNSLVR